MRILACQLSSFFSLIYLHHIHITDIYIRLHSQKRHRLEASCGFYQPDTSCQQVVSSLLTSSSLWTSDLLQLINLIFADLLQQLASSLHAVRNLQQVC